MTDPEATGRPRTSTRDHDLLRHQLVDWLAGRVDEPEVSKLTVPETNGMSSETLLFEATWRDGGARHTQACAARLRPDPLALPVFPLYDLERQFRVMRLVGERSAVPVPRTLWYEGDDGPLGSPFFVMERVEGQVPPDIMPYTFGSWLSEASTDQQRKLQDASVGILAQLHGLAASPDELAFLELDQPGTTALRRHVADQAAYYEWVASDGVRSPLIERTFAYLDQHWPVEEGPTVISWGDSRIGNMLYRDFEPVGVLDWEMAAVGPAEIDIGWMVFLHRFFQDMTEEAGMPGMPGFLRVDDVAGTYEALSGRPPRHLQWYMLYAALRHGIVMSRVKRRSVHFGEAELPDDPDDFIMHRATIEAMLDGTYWERL